MDSLTITLSPGELLTGCTNRLCISIRPCEAVSRVMVKAECRLVADGKTRERYLLGEKSFPGSPSGFPDCSEWDISVSKKGPLSFTSPFFSLEHVVLVEVFDRYGKKTEKEIPITVMAGRITEESGEKA